MALLNIVNLQLIRCNPQDGDKDSSPSRESVLETSQAHSSMRPVAVKCKTCGKEFGKASIKFHEPQCEKKKLADDLRKEKEKEAQEEKPVSYMDHIGKTEISNQSSN